MFDHVNLMISKNGLKPSIIIRSLIIMSMGVGTFGAMISYSIIGSTNESVEKYVC